MLPTAHISSFHVHISSPQDHISSSQSLFPHPMNPSPTNCMQSDPWQPAPPALSSRRSLLSRPAAAMRCVAGLERLCSPRTRLHTGPLRLLPARALPTIPACGTCALQHPPLVHLLPLSTPQVLRPPPRNAAPLPRHCGFSTCLLPRGHTICCLDAPPRLSPTTTKECPAPNVVRDRLPSSVKPRSTCAFVCVASALRLHPPYTICRPIGGWACCKGKRNHINSTGLLQVVTPWRQNR